MTLRLALVGGPMYDGMYALLEGLDVEVVVQADHPTLNAEVERLLAAGERLDLISTHGKYAPSQAAWLRPLDDLLDPALVAELAPGAVGLCRGLGGELLCAPRNIDVRLLWRDVERLPEAPATWEDVLAFAEPFGLPGRESGLFGTFFELVVGAGGTLLTADASLALERDQTAAALEVLTALVAGRPEVAGWHYDQVDRALALGDVAMAAAWPGATAALRASALEGRLRPSAYPAGPQRWVSYAGCHAWAIPTTCADVPAAGALLERLAGEEGARLEAASGGVPALTAVASTLQGEDEIDALRLDLLRQTIAEAMITYPAHPRFAGFEDAGWRLVHGALFEGLSADGLHDGLAAEAARLRAP
jgi:multiple sugar transport system substrate-binding protein